MISSSSLRATLALGLLLCVASSCGYYFVAGPLNPTSAQQADMQVADDGGVTYSKDRFDVRMRPMTNEELDRLYDISSEAGPDSPNPYTFGSTDFGDGPQPDRFTVFQISIKNYAYPKVLIDPGRIELVSANNPRQYWSLDQQQLETYLRAYAIGYRGNAYKLYQERMDILRRTMLKPDPVFSGQEMTGYVVFPPLHDDVTEVIVHIHGATLRFDFRGEPVEQIDLSYRFERNVEKRFGGDTDGA